jgi:hypothetical protein
MDDADHADNIFIQFGHEHTVSSGACHKYTLCVGLHIQIGDQL